MAGEEAQITGGFEEEMEGMRRVEQQVATFAARRARELAAGSKTPGHSRSARYAKAVDVLGPLSGLILQSGNGLDPRGRKCKQSANMLHVIRLRLENGIAPNP
jgi:hypothetical protein